MSPTPEEIAGFEFLEKAITNELGRFGHLCKVAVQKTDNGGLVLAISCGGAAYGPLHTFVATVLRWEQLDFRKSGLCGPPRILATYLVRNPRW